MATCVYGGSFDPPHVGHVLAVQYLLSVGLADRVIVVPVYQHAFEKSLSPYETRVEMCERAFAADGRVTVSRVESTLPRPSYTLHTLKALKKEIPAEQLRLVVGADVLSETPRWHGFDEIKELAPLLVLGRLGFETDGAFASVLPDVSSTEARTWWGAQPSAEDRRQRERLIPAAVRELIEERGLYRG